MRPSPVRLRTGFTGARVGCHLLVGFLGSNFALEIGPRKLPVLPAASGRLEGRSLSKSCNVLHLRPNIDLGALTGEQLKTPALHMENDGQ